MFSLSSSSISGKYIGDKDDFSDIFQLDKKISLIEVDNINNLNSTNDTMSSKLEKIYEHIKKKPTYKEIIIFNVI